MTNLPIGTFHPYIVVTIGEANLKMGQGESSQRSFTQYRRSETNLHLQPPVHKLIGRSLTWAELTDYLDTINTRLSILTPLIPRCKENIALEGSYLMFAIKNGTGDGTELFWKITLRVMCLKVLTLSSNSVEG